MAARFLAGLLSVTMVLATRHDKARITVHSLDSLSVVPHPITQALRRAQKSLNNQLELMAAAETEASAKKASMEAAKQKKWQHMKMVENQTDHLEVVSKSHREMSVAVEKAATAHMASGKDHEAALDKFQGLAKEADDLQDKITSKTEAFMKELERWKKELEDLKDEHAKKVQERDQAQQAANDLEAKLLAANKHKAGVEQEQAKAQKAMNDAEKELQDMQANLDTAASAATKAEVEESEASSALRLAQSNTARGNRTRALLMELKEAVQTYYNSIRTLEKSMMASEGQGKAYDRIKKDANLKVVYGNYNLMVSSFTDIHTFDEGLYAEVKPAQPFIQKNSFSEIVYICDPFEEFGELPDNIAEIKGTAMDQHCGQGLWDALDLTKSSFP